MFFNPLLNIRFSCVFKAYPVKLSYSITPMLAAATLLSITCTYAPKAFAATKVAFIADQGVGIDSREVLTLIKDENADIVFIQGDFGYADNTALLWDQHITDILGRNFPVLGLVGNHENFEWPLYQRLIKDRINRAGGISCNGDIGVKAECTYKNLQLVQVAQGVSNVAGVSANDNYDGYIRSSLSDSDSVWRICTWHKNQNAVQAYSKGNDTGWEIYDACLEAGAMVVTGHSHTYSRTYLMSDFRNQKVVHRNSEMTLEPGKSFVAVSGLGGRNTKPQVNTGDWFASVYTQTQGATHGALFCTFEQSTADCYFKAVDGAVPDQFSLRLGDGILPQTPPTDDDVPTGSGVFSRTDKSEYLWIARNDSGQWTRSWISKDCATEIGVVTYSGRWSTLTSLAPVVANLTPCDNNTANQPAPQSDNPTSGGYVFSRTDKNEFRWIATNSDGQIGSVWIDSACASQLGGATESGNWSNLIDRAPGFDTLEYPCGASGSTSGLQNTLPANETPAQPFNYVFARSNKDEFWWIGKNASGTASYIWIDEACATSLGGASAQGDWQDLNNRASGSEPIARPC